MNWQSLQWRLARLFGHGRSERELDDEIRAHLAIDVRERIEAGETPEAARLKAARQFGNLALVKEVTREVWTVQFLERVWQDARYAVRSLSRSFGFTMTALAALALGIGATTSTFTVLYSVILRPLPFPEPERLVGLWEKPPKGGQNVVSLLNFKAWKERAKSFAWMAAYNERPTNLLGGDEPIQTVGANVTADFFRVLRVEPLLGRGFAPGEDGPGAPPVAVLSYGFWQRRFGGQGNVVGQRISMGGTPHEVIGVMPPGFAFPSERVDLFTNLRAEYSGRDFFVVARLGPGVGAGGAEAELASIAAVTAVEMPGMNAGYSATLVPLHEQTVGRIRPLLRVLFGTVLFVLLIACANVANLLLMRSLGRDREMSVRLALGAGRWRLAQQLAVEALLLTGAGGLLGAGAASWGLRGLLATLPANFPLPRMGEIGVDGMVLWFTAGLCVVLGLVLGLVPVFLAGRREVCEGLRSGNRSVAPGQRRFRQTMVVTEIAVALVLVIGAGLMVQSLARLHETNLGFQTERILTMRMMMLPGKPAVQGQKLDEILRRVRALPLVASASSINISPMTGVNSGTWYYRADRPEPEKENRPSGGISLVMPSYFRTMSIPMLQGRDFDDRDRLGGVHAGILNRTAARMLFGEEDPMGKRVRVHWNNAGEVEVVGVVADIRHRNPQSKPDPCVYLSNVQLPFPLASLAVRTTADPRAVIAAVKAEIHQVDPDQGVAEVLTMAERVANAEAQPRVQAWLVSSFSLIALVLACIGIYGVISYTVSQRTREIGVRIALGAGRLGIVGQILRESLTVAAVGVGIGLITSLVLTRYLETLLYEVKPADPGIYGGVTVLMLLVSAIASYFPSRRAAAVDPVVALRQE